MRTMCISLTAGFDVIVDAMDNMPTRFLLNKAAIKHNIPFVHGAVSGLEGRAMTVIPGKSACIRCMYHAFPAKNEISGTWHDAGSHRRDSSHRSH